jgi:hypothetical protein
VISDCNWAEANQTSPGIWSGMFFQQKASCLSNPGSIKQTHRVQRTNQEFDQQLANHFVLLDGGD